MAHREPPKAFVCYNDSLGVEVCHWAAQRGIDIPDALSVVGIDNSREARESEIPLTSVERGGERMAAVMVRLLISRIKGNHENEPEIVAIRPSQVIVRDSTSAAPVGERQRIEQTAGG